MNHGSIPPVSTHPWVVSLIPSRRLVRDISLSQVFLSLRPSHFLPLKIEENILKSTMQLPMKLDISSMTVGTLGSVCLFFVSLLVFLAAAQIYSQRWRKLSPAFARSRSGRKHGFALPLPTIASRFSTSHCDRELNTSESQLLFLFGGGRGERKCLPLLDNCEK